MPGCSSATHSRHCTKSSIFSIFSLAPLSICDWREEGGEGGRVIFAFERKRRRRRRSEDDGEERGGRAASQGTAFYMEEPLYRGSCMGSPLYREILIKTFF